MKMQDVRAIAKDRGIKVGKLKKFELIREIQADEGNVTCYATDADGSCQQVSCLWNTDCVASAKKIAS